MHNKDFEQLFENKKDIPDYGKTGGSMFKGSPYMWGMIVLALLALHMLPQPINYMIGAILFVVAGVAGLIGRGVK